MNDATRTGSISKEAAPTPALGAEPGSVASRRVSAVIGCFIKCFLRSVAIALGLLIAALPALLCRAESMFSSRGEFMMFCGQALALLPGLPGSYLRVCFYFLTLKSCSLSCNIGFLSYFSDRQAELGQGVIIGSHVTIGRVSIGARSLIGSRSSLMSGGRQHQFGPDGRLTSFNRAEAQHVRVGEDTWIGESSMVMADVGSRCIISAGSVVTNAVPDRQIWGGNPARFIKRH